MGDTYTPTGNYRLACVAHGASPSDDLVVNAPPCQGAQDRSMMRRWFTSESNLTVDPEQTAA
jgi:hypothetical protein